MPRRFAQFLGRAAYYYPDLHKFWVEQPATRKIFTNPIGRVGWQDCTIMEPSNLSEGISQLLEGRLVALQKCTNFTRKLLSLQLDQVWVSSLWGEWINCDRQAAFMCRKHWSLSTWRSKTKCCVRLVGEAPKQAKAKFWRVVVAATTISKKIALMNHFTNSS